MPQVDTFTFYTIVFWTFFIYLTGYLILTTIVFFGFLTKLKSFVSGFLSKNYIAAFFGLLLAALSFFSLILV